MTPLGISSDIRLLESGAVAMMRLRTGTSRRRSQRSDAVGVAVGADDDVVGLHAAARGLDLEAAVLWREAEHRRLPVHDRAGFLGQRAACRDGTSPDAGRRCRRAPCRRGRSRCRARRAAPTAAPHRPRCRASCAGASASRARPSYSAALAAPVKRPVSWKSQSMPSRRMKSAKSSRAALASSWSALARSSPNLRDHLPVARPQVAAGDAAVAGRGALAWPHACRRSARAGRRAPG